MTATAIIPAATRTRREMACRRLLFVSGMSSPVVLIAIVVLWFVLNRYVLPRFGINT